MRQADLTAAIDKMTRNRDTVFEVVFRRRTDKVEKGVIIEPAGSERSMLCTMQPIGEVPKAAKDPGRRKVEDAKNLCLTVHEVGVGFKRVPLDSIVSITEAL